MYSKPMKEEYIQVKQRKWKREEQTRTSQDGNHNGDVKKPGVETELKVA